MGNNAFLMVVAGLAAALTAGDTFAMARPAQGSPAEIAYRRNIAAGMKTPATSRLFDKVADPETGVVSYILKPGIHSFNQQSLYFTAKSMTDDGRFLVFWASGDEFPPERKGRRLGQRKTKVLIDFMKDELIPIGVCGDIPFLDTATDQMWYMDSEGIHRRDLLIDPGKDILLCPVPPELVSGKGRSTRYGTHITLSPDRRIVFLDTCVDGQDLEGVIDTETGKWTQWARSDFMCNHGQFNPRDPTLAMCAWEMARYKVVSEMTPKELSTAKIGKAGKYLSDILRSRDDVYPRLWLMREGKAWEVTSKITNYATHEYFTEDGKGFYWCSNGVFYHDLATGRQWCIDPLASAHATMTADNRYVISDCSWGGWWRGCGWRVQFWNRETHRGVVVHSKRPAIASKDNQSSLHPDPHPQFVCSDRYVVCTYNGEDRRMNLSVTPVDQLIAITSDPATAPAPKRFRLAFDPSSRTDATYEMEIDVKPLRDRHYVSEPPCPVGDSYTAFSLRAVAGGVERALPFEAVQGTDNRRNVVLRFRIPEQTEEMFCIADAPGRFEYYDSESCANLFGHDAYAPDKAASWTCAAGVRATPHRAGLVFSKEASGGDAIPVASLSADVPADAAGRNFKFELDIRNLGEADWKGGVRLVQVDGAGKDIDDALAGKGQGTAVSPDRRGVYRLTGAFSPRARKVRLELGLAAEGNAPAKVLVCRLNLREATVFPFASEMKPL